MHCPLYLTRKVLSESCQLVIFLTLLQSKYLFLLNAPTLYLLIAWPNEISQHITPLEQGNFSHDAVAKHLREVYEPLISADGEKWRKLPPFGCIFKTSCNEATDVWLETRLYHFSENAVGKLVSLSKQKKLSGPVHVGEIPRWKGYRDHVVFGNDTKASVTLVSCLIAVSSCSRQSTKNLP